MVGGKSKSFSSRMDGKESDPEKKRSDSSSVECSESEFFFDRFNLKEALLGGGGGVSEEFILSQLGKRLHEYF